MIMPVKHFQTSGDYSGEKFRKIVKSLGQELSYKTNPLSSFPKHMEEVLFSLQREIETE